MVQGQGYPLPEYRLLTDEGPPHRKKFLVQCEGKAAGIKVTGKGGSRRKAEQEAASVALDFIEKNQKSEQS
jgi:ribonuclease-3